MALVTLSVLVPMVAGTVLAATAPVERRRLAAALAVAAVLASLVLLAITLHRVAGGHLVVWWGGWAPHGRVVGIDFADRKSVG